MKNITTRQYRILADHMDIYQFMVEIYEKDWKNGVPAPFLEYALSSSWMSKEFTHRNRIWFDNNQIVGFVFTENPTTDIYFSLRPGYAALVDEMVEYAHTNMPGTIQTRQFVIFKGQDAIMKAAEKKGYVQVYSYEEMVFDFDKALDYPLPDGFYFTEPGKISADKIDECCWKGFDHEAEEGPWDGDAESNYHIQQAPHFMPERPIAVVNDKGEYVCFAGMWWVPENRLAYMEPLCTVPEYRRRGLAAALLSEHYRRMKPLGATHMTGGGDEFYKKIGFQPGITWTYWKMK